MYAVFLDREKQYKAAQGDQVLIDYREAEPGSTLEFQHVLLCGGGPEPIVGSPHIPNAKVVAEVQGHELGRKIYVQHMRRRKDSRRRVGHRQKHTRIIVRDIVVPGAVGSGAPEPTPTPREATGPTEDAAS